VAIDLPGHGRSDWRRDGRYEPGKLAPAVAEAIRSFAPRARIVAGAGLGGLTAVALHRRHPRLLARLALVNTLPGAGPDRAQAVAGRQAPEGHGCPERFAGRADAFAVLASRRPERGSQAIRREILYELIQDPDGSWEWRHHPGNLPSRLVTGPDDNALWEELAGFAGPVTLIRGDWGGPLEAADLAALRQRVPQARVLTIPGTGVDIAATQVAAWFEGKRYVAELAENSAGR
jgi:pimeloyl-ACP methyl ester carboxylesterase